MLGLCIFVRVHIILILYVTKVLHYINLKGWSYVSDLFKINYIYIYIYICIHIHTYIYIHTN